MTTDRAAATLDWAAVVQERAAQKVTALANRVGGAFLHATVDGRYTPVEGEWWTSGFWPGMLWLVYQRTRDERLAALARQAEDELEQLLLDDRFYELHHDVGFQFIPTSLANYKITGNTNARRRSVLAASLLMGRFNVAGNFFEAWNGERRRGMSIIDTMMNLPLLFWTAEETHQPRFRHMAEAHAQMAQQQFVRPDGTTNHIVRFNQETGEPIEPLGGQGYAPDSTWSRGQSWALYGFTLAYRYTGKTTYLDTARLVADNFVAALPKEGVPPWDFRVPDVATAPRDSSAGAVAASGLLELAFLLPENEGEPYRQSGIKLLDALNEHCATWDQPEQDALLLHATGKLPENQNIDVSLIYGDYYFLEALGKLNGITQTCW